MAKKCVVCGTEFKGRGRADTCSKECTAAKREKAGVQAKRANENMAVPPWETDTTDRPRTVTITFKVPVYDDGGDLGRRINMHLFKREQRRALHLMRMGLQRSGATIKGNMGENIYVKSNHETIRFLLEKAVESMNASGIRLIRDNGS